MSKERQERFDESVMDQLFSDLSNDHLVLEWVNQHKRTVFAFGGSQPSCVTTDCKLCKFIVETLEDLEDEDEEDDETH